MSCSTLTALRGDEDGSDRQANGQGAWYGGMKRSGDGRRPWFGLSKPCTMCVTSRLYNAGPSGLV